MESYMQLILCIVVCMVALCVYCAASQDPPKGA